MFKRPELSRTIASNTQIILHAFQNDMINPGRYLISRPRYELTILPKCDLFYKNEKIGKLTAEVNQEDQNSIYLYFHKLKNIDFDYTFAVFDIDCKSLRCPSCKRYFSVGDKPCDCLEKSLFFYISEVTASSVNLYDIRNDNIDTFDFRNNLYSKFFGGTLRSLKFMDPI